MTPGHGLAVSPSLRLKLGVLIVGPVLAGLATAGIGVLRWNGDFGPPDVEARGRLAAVEFERLLHRAAVLTNGALETFPPQRGEPRPGTLDSRLEGVGILGPDGLVEAWAGTPADLDVPAAPDVPRWQVRIDGVRTRLLVRTAPADDGRTAWASFVLDSRLAELRFAELWPAWLSRGVYVDARFGPPAVDGEADDAPAGSVVVPLRAPTGELLGLATVHPIPSKLLRSQVLEFGLVWAAICLVLLVGLLFDWRRLVRSGRGLLAALALLLLGRFVLVWARMPSALLPRELGSASLYGSPECWGLLASPADLLLTALALLLICGAFRRWCIGVASRRRSVALPASLAGAAAATLALGSLTVSVAHNSRVPLLDAPGLLDWGGRAAVTLALVLTMYGAAQLWSAPWAMLSTLRPWTTALSGRLGMALAFLLLVLAFSVSLQALTRHLALQRLESELAPRMLEQSAHRSVALSEAVRSVAETLLDPESPQTLHGNDPRYLAYDFWVGSRLFHSGYKSSLDLYTPGNRISHFGFGLPALDELPPPDPDGSETLRVWEEGLPAQGGRERTLLHAEMPVYRDGLLVGTVVGHVLDEPENVPFLPASRPYLAALGPGSPGRTGEGFPGGPKYVLYDAFGNILLATIERPPALSDSLREAARGSEPVKIRGWEESFVGLALQDGGRVHLLLIEDPGLLERLASSMRLALFGLLLLAALDLLSRIVRARGVMALVHEIRGSFRRKLLAALLVASVFPLVFLALFLRGYIENRGELELRESATQVVGAVQRLLEDYAAVQDEPSSPDGLGLDDNILHWLGRVVSHEIHVFRGGELQATSVRELFASGLLPPRLDGTVQRKLVYDGLPQFLQWGRIGSERIPVIYAPVRSVDPHLELVVAVPLVVEPGRIIHEAERVVEMLLLSTVLLVVLLSVAAVYASHTVSRPVRELVGATGKISAGDYGTRLVERTRDEVAELVRGFNRMATALGAQRADLERQRDYMETLLRHATMGVISTDPQGRVVTFNPAAGELLAACGAELQPGRSLYPALSRSRELEPLAEALQTPRRGRAEAREVDLQTESRPRRFRFVRVELPDPAGGSVGTLVLLDDVTELMRSNQLAAWAEMARAIAHEIKNPLTPIQLSAEHLKRLLADRGVLPAREIDSCLDTVFKQVRTLYDIAEEFSAYAKLPVLAPRSEDPVSFMRETIDPYRSASQRGISIDERYEPTSEVAIDRRVLSRALVNLVENALQAMPNGGTLSLSVSERGGEVLLSVADDGAGLEPEVRRRLFEPYFSTKSSGTGLGLAIARRAVEAHRGRIEVDSAPGTGTTFRIHLPRGKPSAES